MSECTVSVAEHGGATVATMKGELTLLNALGIGKELEARVEHGTETVVLDLSGVTFLDSAGIQLLFRINRLVGSWGGRLRLVVPSSAPVHRIIRIVDPGGYIPLHATPAEALGAPTGDAAGSETGLTE
jgi:anti-sigma B factor antagonist